MSEIELKACPFCGAEAEICDFERCLDGSAYEDVFQVYCLGCSIERREFDSPIDAANDWNTRADGWVSVDDELPKIGQRVDLFANGVVQDEVYQFDASDYGDIAIYFWCREGLEEYPEVSEGQYWRPRPQPPKNGVVK